MGSNFRPLVTGMGESKIPDADGQFVNAPIFNWNDGKLHFNNNWTNNANKQYGSASGFLPKSLLKMKSIHWGAFSLVSARGTYPASEHPSYLICFLLKSDILLGIYRFDFL